MHKNDRPIAQLFIFDCSFNNMLYAMVLSFVIPDPLIPLASEETIYWLFSKINPLACREWAEKNYSMERVGKMYKEYFQRFFRLFDNGWYEINEDRKELDWLERYYPAH